MLHLGSGTSDLNNGMSYFANLLFATACIAHRDLVEAMPRQAGEQAAAEILVGEKP